MELTFDDFLSNRVGLGKHQYVSFIILSMIEFMSGFQEIFVGTQIKIVTNEWSLSETQQMVMGSIFYAGVMIGNIICSLLADIAGRRVMLLISQSFTLITILLNSFAADFYQVLVALFAYGLLFGIAMPISQVVVSEIIPLKYRGRYIVLLQLIYIFGILYLTGCCFIFLDSYSSGDWRSLLRVNSIPALLCLIGSVLFLRESPRLYIAQGQYERGFMELDSMGLKNNKMYQPITIEEQNAIKQWRETILKSQMDARSVKGLFTGYNFRITMTIWAIFITFNVISSGIQTITPYILEDSDSGFLAALFSYSAEIPAIIFVVVLIDNKQYGGRTRCTIFGLVLLCIVQMGVWYFQKPFVVTGQILQRFSIRVVWSCLNALPAESYSTVYRSMGVGAAQGLGKGSATASPFFILWLYYQNMYLPFLVCSGVSLITLFFVFTYPVNATLKPLDRINTTSDKVNDLRISDGGSSQAEQDLFSDKADYKKVLYGQKNN